MYLCQETITPVTPSQNEASQPVNSHLMSAISISMPSSPLEVHLQNPKSFLFCDRGETMLSSGILDSPAISNTGSTKLPRHPKFHSQPMPTGSMYPGEIAGDKFPNQTELQAKNPRIEGPKDKRFNSFKTWPGQLGRQLSNLCGKPHESDTKQKLKIGMLPADRYFDALEGPELNTLKVCVSSFIPFKNFMLFSVVHSQLLASNTHQGHKQPSLFNSNFVLVIDVDAYKHIPGHSKYLHWYRMAGSD